MKNKFLLVLPIIVLSTSCKGSTQRRFFKLWNNCESLNTLIDYVKDVTNKRSKNYIPVEDRIATFDMDGTFIGELYPTYFEYNLLEYRALDDASYKDVAPEDVKDAAQKIRNFVRDGVKLPDDFEMEHAKAAAKAYAGMSIADFDKYVKDYAKTPANGFNGMTYGESFYKPMLEVFKYLEKNDFTYYVVSGSDRFICRALVDSLGIAPNRVIGMDVELKTTKQDKEDYKYTMDTDEYVIRTENVLIKNVKNSKVKQIEQEIGKIPVLSFSNSSGDEAMHNLCKTNKEYKTETFMLIADDPDEDHVNLDETAKRKEKWETNKYNIISMKDDFKTIYGTGVTKADFHFN